NCRSDTSKPRGPSAMPPFRRIRIWRPVPSARQTTAHSLNARLSELRMLPGYPAIAPRSIVRRRRPGIHLRSAPVIPGAHEVIALALAPTQEADGRDDDRLPRIDPLEALADALHLPGIMPAVVNDDGVLPQVLRRIPPVGEVLRRLSGGGQVPGLERAQLPGHLRGQVILVPEDELRFSGGDLPRKERPSPALLGGNQGDQPPAHPDPPRPYGQRPVIEAGGPKSAPPPR